MSKQEKESITTVDEMLRWKLDSEQCEKLGVVKVFHQSVEKTNVKKIKELEWKEQTDTLYSFLLTYRLGLEVTNEKRFFEIYDKYKTENAIDRLNVNCPMFLYTCSCDSEFEKFNSQPEWKEFVSRYFEIGNVIPIWPGGNEARGKKGIYDIPEVFFNQYKDWTDLLIKKYPNAQMDQIVNNDWFIVCRPQKEGGGYIKGYKNVFLSFGEFRKTLKDNQKMYFDYLKHRNDVIQARTESLEKN